jgi:hypothetical protein
MLDASSVEYWDKVCAMNSVSSVACIKAAREKVGRDRNAESNDEDTSTRRCVKMVASNEDGALGDERLELGETVDGMVVEISVCTSTKVSMVL